jgi:hypothetical protein
LSLLDDLEAKPRKQEEPGRIPGGRRGHVAAGDNEEPARRYGRRLRWRRA